MLHFKPVRSVAYWKYLKMCQASHTPEPVDVFAMSCHLHIQIAFYIFNAGYVETTNARSCMSLIIIWSNSDQFP